MRSGTPVQILLTWDPSNSVDVIGYNLYRCTVPKGQSSCVPNLNGIPVNGKAPIAGLKYVDRALLDTTVVWDLVAVASDGEVSKPDVVQKTIL